MTYEELAAYCVAAHYKKELPTATLHTCSNIQFVAVDNDEDLVIAFAGTNEASDWIKNLNYALAAPATLEGKVHTGFYEAALEAWDCIVNEVELDDKKVWVTGTSLGGAVALVVSALLVTTKSPPEAIVTFGSPRPGDSVFAKQFAMPVYRVVNGLDLITWLPFWRPYCQVGKLIRIGKFYDVLKNFIVLKHHKPPAYLKAVKSSNLLEVVV
jgi:predicted lipase